MLPIPSTVTVQPASVHQLQNRSRAWRSISVSASRGTPPFYVAPILARSISDFHSRCASIEIAAINRYLEKISSHHGENRIHQSVYSRFGEPAIRSPRSERSALVVCSALRNTPP